MSVLLIREHWIDAAACAKPGMPDVWFPGSGPTGERAARAAKRICATCPVRQECLQHALTWRESAGVWGGMTETERQRHPENRPRRRGEPAPSGTESGYRRHLKNGEPACGACRMRMRLLVAERRRKRQRKAAK